STDPLWADPAQGPAGLRARRDGDDSARDRSIARWEQPLLAFAWRYLRHTIDARDVVAETFVRLYQQRERFRPNTMLTAWLFTAVANRCRNQHRWRMRHPTTSLDSSEADRKSTRLNSSHV